MGFWHVLSTPFRGIYKGARDYVVKPAGQLVVGVEKALIGGVNLIGHTETSIIHVEDSLTKLPAFVKIGFIGVASYFAIKLYMDR